MAKLLCAFVLAGLIFQVSALDWHPTHWIPNPLKWVPNPFKWISDHTGWISRLNPLHWFEFWVRLGIIDGGLDSSKYGNKCDHCELQAVMGPCSEVHTHYYYNIVSRQCEQFLYGGCKGNKNNFRTKRECEKSCIKLRGKVFY
ncbi:hypothetical protein TNCV_4827981 [Trichonephila clavipes]|uniref:BPTI/Kunitz inhibitor domain-containing protein n=1 Tax=Trichonephila clavipes TaxID=2585209 RepID=A0A8X6SIY9_TRICX|nr:hypothetical protein TNCV_4827981 [Trichonephila clavipes]